MIVANASRNGARVSTTIEEPTTEERLEQLEAKTAKSDSWTVITLALAAAVALASIVAVGFIARRDSGDTPSESARRPARPSRPT